MITTISKTQFRDEFTVYNWQDQFSYEALGALDDYLTDLDEQCDLSIELDVIALCCEYSEYDNYYDAVMAYSNDRWHKLEDHTTVIYTGEYASNSSVIVQEY